MYYGVYVVNDDEMYLMNSNEVMAFLSEKSPLFLTYSIYSDGENIVVSEPSAGPNGSFGSVPLAEFFCGFEEDGIIIRPIILSEWFRGRI
ncbi:hypothetical protein ABGV42_00230 [Paenibacillus pabuli]|uniref:hypothetical protein n=1 Tax=Paenibacillus pabuli TaxID=1472 RepID=UPI003241EB43